MAEMSKIDGMVLKQPSGEAVSLTGTLVASPMEDNGGPIPQARPALTHALSSEKVLDQANCDQQQTWDDAVHRNMRIDDSYDCVGVLLINWDPDLDDLDVAAEVDELEAIFKDKYHFETQRLELNNKTRTQNQLNVKLSQFVDKYDVAESRNLIVVYYSGHGVWQNDKKHFFLEAKYHPDQIYQGQKRFLTPDANWNLAEGPLLASETDVLVILDSCRAGNLQLKGGYDAEEKAYEVLCAGAAGRMTERPGPGSFTHALITVLNKQAELENCSFTTNFMNQRIMEIRHENPPILFNRRARPESPIRLAPVVVKSPCSNISRRLTHHDEALLTLNFHIRKHELTPRDIDNLTRHLPKAFINAEVACDRMGWVSLRPRHRFRNAARKIARSQSTVKKWGRSGSATNALEGETPQMTSYPAIVDDTVIG